MTARNEDLADRAVATMRARLVGRAVPLASGEKVTVSSVFHYGAVDIDPRHLVVWVLLVGADPSRLPGWWSPTDATAPFAGELVPWLAGIAAAIDGEFRSIPWPGTAPVTVLFDSDERVQLAGGWSYFR